MDRANASKNSNAQRDASILCVRTHGLESSPDGDVTGLGPGLAARAGLRHFTLGPAAEHHPCPRGRWSCIRPRAAKFE
jgi:hypothetical protein